ncbi:lysine--tRNA ligase [Bifidobacterium animalis subsp. lactis]|nr:Lysine--tRNA ligase [Bifidobacterium animalis subsp. lactis CNCM I-2494]AXM93525.1 lysine--tRNA ligase [Bifidobacterium animalis subsp. lactis]KAB5633725.1 lysine--tRNA ligase [Bifidobacterium animalis]KOA45776.1 lysyl-tRNA synthetase [Bifidobacterium animalis subsp. lactis ATCC 27536]KOA47108.1 lysyl-tRNA synthetase [Bifidobacterium animalis subsp. lactis ATCC 27673]KOA51330.1 lysyl-tRNA synthetase [Bifidobacterium animalis subsp. lactis ATCC 27674]PIN32409.1 lysine--tRNA ligase [Bifidoba
MIDYAEASEKRTVFGTFAVCFTEASVCRGMRAFAQGGRAGECSESLLDCCAMTEANESADITVEEEVVAAPEMSTVERAEMLLNQDEAIFKRVQEGASLDEAVDPSNKEFGPLAHPEQVQTRVAKRAMMIKDGINPYPVNLDVTTTIDAVRVKYDGKLEAGAETDDIVGVAGRVLFIRNAGGLCFVQLAAGDGTTIQAMLSKKQIGADSLKQFKQLVDLGDHLFVKGRVIASKTGELSIFADEWAIAAKALQPLPTLHKELNEDTRTRKPYIGMIADEKIRNMVRNRSRAVASLRRTFDEHGFLEVETPMLQTIHGGAAARPFTTHMNAFDLDLYLRIAPELFLKRCLVGGIEKVFEINRDFRNEGVDATHAPEFTMVEAYEAYGNYDTIAKLVKELIQKTAIDVFGSTKVTLLDGTEYDFGGEWKTMSMYDSLSEALGQQITPETSVEELGAIADRLGVERDEVENHGKLVEHLWEHFYEDKLYEPTFVRDFPVETSPLVKAHRSKPGVVEKWDLYVRGFELATGYSELNDPIVQRERFVAQAKDALAGDEEACDIDEDFLEALGVGMPPAGGMGMGIDRLLIALTGATIRETITFPLVKPLNN